MRKVMGICGLLLLIASGVVNFLTYEGLNLTERYPAVWALFPAVIIVFVFTMILLSMQFGGRSGRRDTYAAALGLLPRWTWGFLLTGIAYLIVITILYGTSTLWSFGITDEGGGKYILNNHGQITEYTLQQAEFIKLCSLRVISAFWMWLTVVSTLYLLTATRYSPTPLTGTIDAPVGTDNIALTQRS
jgi:hypothetical protein